MAYANPFPTYTTNPLSPQREMNARPMNAATTNPADVRGTLSRRFTTNALPTLSPIGPQRRQAVGTMANVSVHSAFHTGDLDVTGTVGFDLRENGGEAGMEAELVDEEKEEEGQVRVEILQGTGNLGKRWLELEPQIAVMLTNNDEQTYSRIPPVSQSQFLSGGQIPSWIRAFLLPNTMLFTAIVPRSLASSSGSVS